MSTTQTRNDLNAAVPKFCFELEMHRRTVEGRVRTAHEFLLHFFPHDNKSSTDRLFKYLPNDVRAPILTVWGVRGRKSALRDEHEKVQAVVHDALVAGDIDGTMFEDGLAADVIMRWVDLADWWAFWRGGKLTKYTLLRALESGYEAALFDAEWFLDTLRGRGGKLKATDVLAEGLSKSDLTEWVRRIHEVGDGSPRGMVTALGWDQIVAKTTDDVLIAALDAMALKVGLVVSKETKPQPVKEAVPKAEAPKAAPIATEVKAEPRLPGLIVPPAAVVDGKSAATTAGSRGEVTGSRGEVTLEGEAAASIFKDEEMISIAPDAMDDDEGPAPSPRPSQLFQDFDGQKAQRGKSKPPGKRPSGPPFRK